MTLVIGSLQLGFLYGILALGIYVTFRILNIPDLTAEGSFTLGLAASAVCTLAGNPVAGIVAAAVAGALAGCDRRTPDEDGDSCGISWHPHNVRALHHQPDCDGKQPEYFPHQCSDHI